MAGAKAGDARTTLSEAANQVGALRDVPDHRLRDKEAEAWESLYKGFRAAARADPEAFNNLPRAAVKSVLEFLVTYAAKKAVLKSRIRECLQIVLAKPDWLGLAQAFPPDLKSKLEQLLEGDEATLERLGQSYEAVPKEATEVVELKLLDVTEASEHLKAGVEIVQNFGGSYPAKSSTSAERDTATEGFNKLYFGVNRLANMAEKRTSQANLEQCTVPSLSEFDDYWSDVARFLAGMHQERSVFSSKIEFVILKLSHFSPSFRAASEREA